MTVEAVEKTFLQQLKEKLPKRRILCTPAGSEARVLSIELFTREVKKQVGHSPSLNVRIDMAPASKRFMGRPDPCITILGDYGEGIKRTYKIGPGTYFNPRAVDTIVEYAERKAREAMIKKEQSDTREATDKLVEIEMKKFARPDTRAGGWFYRGQWVGRPTSRPNGQVQVRHRGPYVWPDEIKAYLDLLLDFEEACAKLGCER